MYLHYHLSVGRVHYFTQHLLHQEGEVQLILRHVRQGRLLQQGINRDTLYSGCEITLLPRIVIFLMLQEHLFMKTILCTEDQQLVLEAE